MRLLSLKYLALNARQAFLRFPLTLISGFIAVGFGIYLNEFKSDLSNPSPYVNLVLTAALGIPMFVCVDVFAYSRGYDKKPTWLIRLFGLIILVVIYFMFPGEESTQNTSIPYIRYAIYAVILHLLVAFVPFTGKGQTNGFWHYNRILFVRFVTSVLYSAFLYGGLSLALGSMRFLFDIYLDGKLFLDLFIIVAGIFNTWFFLAGIPGHFDSLDEIREYPKGVKVFSQFVLLPLVVLYLLILYIYAGKIVLLWSWPKGIVSYLVVCVAVLGILTLLLIHPYGNLPGNAWIRKCSRLYYFILFPLVILLFIAIGMRVADYGITINRYILILLGVWLTITCTYFAIAKSNIKFIPVSLAVVLAVASFGYWGMFSVSERSQVKRLRSILESNNILEDGKIQREVMWRRDSLPALYAIGPENTNDSVLRNVDHNELISIVDYLDEHHGFASIQEWFHQDLDSIVAVNDRSLDRWTHEAETYVRTMGLRSGHKSDTWYRNFSFWSHAAEKNVVNVRDYDYLVTFKQDISPPQVDSFNIDGKIYTLAPPIALTDKFVFAGESDSIAFDTDELIQKLLAKYPGQTTVSISPLEMILYEASARIETKVEFDFCAVNGMNDSLHWSTLSGNLFIRLKRK